MPQVPYTPVPDVTPTDASPRGFHIDTPGSAFGTTIADAVKGVGGDLNKASDEIFQRAVALQELNNRADADKKVSDYVIAAGQKHAEFSALQGQDAVKAFPKYMQDVQDLRDQFGTGLNPMAKRYYDSESRGQMARTIFNGAGHAATQQKQWMIQNAEAQVDLDTKSVADDPNNEDLYNKQVAKVNSDAQYLASLHGYDADSPFAQDKAMKAKSQITLTRILTMARTEPLKAMDLYKRLEGNLDGSDKLHAEVGVWGQTRSVGAQNIAQQVWSDGFDENGKRTTSLPDMLTKGAQLAEQQMPGDPVLRKAVEQNIRTMNTRQFQTEKISDWEADQNIRDLIQQHPEITSEQQLRALPEARAILDSLNFKGRGIDAPGYIHRYIDSKFKEVNEDTYYRMKALAEHDRGQFLDIDFTDPQSTGGPMNQRQIDQLNTLRKSLIHKPDDDPKLRNALTWMQQAHGPELEALSIYRRTNDTKEDYDRYAGSLLQALEIWQKNNGGKVPGFKDVTEEIGPQVIKQHSVPGMFWGTNQVPTYKLEIPSDFKKKIKAEFPNRSDEDIQKDYTGFLFQNLFGPTVSGPSVQAGSGSRGDNIVTNTPSVPQSK